MMLLCMPLNNFDCTAGSMMDHCEELTLGVPSFKVQF